MHINFLIDRFLKDTGLSPTAFGKLAAHDPRLVFDIRNGREIGARLEAKLRVFMIDHRSEQGNAERIAA